MGYRGRFAPSPTGPLHAGSMVAALASWLDARAHGGRWLVRIEDIDTPRCVDGAEQLILQQLAACGLVADEPVLRQSQRGTAYQAALQRLFDSGAAYRCTCSRSQIAAHRASVGLIDAAETPLRYPGTCRERTDIAADARCAVRVRCGSDEAPLQIGWHDRRLGPQQQDVTHSVGDFIVRRSDGLWAYQLAVVVDDAAQRITDVVRGEDLADNTARQIHLQRLLGLPAPAYLHTPLVLAADGRKLSKQNGAQAVDTGRPLQVLQQAGAVLGLHHRGADRDDWLAEAVERWAEKIALRPQHRTPG